MRFSVKKSLVRIGGTLAAATLVVGLLESPAAAAIVTTFAPPCGLAGTSVTITGSGFTGATGVSFPGAAQVIPANASDSTITTTVPAAATGFGPLTVTGAPSGSGTSTHYFGVVAAGAPAVPTPSPTSGVVGSTVTLTGTHLGCTTGVLFNSGALPATTFIPLSDSQLSVTVPVGATGSTFLQVQTSGGNVTLTTAFTVTGTTAAPTITSFSPSCGSAGTAVTVNGTNLATGAASLRFNGVTATILSNTGTVITTTVPNTATTGPISVTVGTLTASSATSFTIPCSGGGGTNHDRTVSFSYSGHTASGQVGVTDGFSQCQKLVPVYFQQLKNGTWSTLDTIATNGSGSYHGFVPSKSGKFRTLVKKQTLADGAVCNSHHSPTRKHN